MSSQKSMLLVTSEWNGTPTFKLIPITADCPYNEVIYAPLAKALAIVGRDKKESFQMVPKLDAQGDPERAKKPRTDGKQYCEQRQVLEAYYEYYITKPEEITDFVDLFAKNADSFDWQQFIPAPAETLKEAA